MARYRGPKFRKIRSLGTPLPGFTKREPSNQNPPGEHGGKWRLGRASTYKLQLMEKQKIRYNYGLTEKKLRMYYKKAARMTGATGQNLLQIIEQRLDNIVARGGFAVSIPAARQLVVHGHITVNGRKVDIPSFSVKVGDVISLKEKSKNIKVIEENLTTGSSIGIASFLEVDPAKKKITMKTLPAREDVLIQVDERMVVEFYSK